MKDKLKLPSHIGMLLRWDMLAAAPSLLAFKNIEQLYYSYLANLNNELAVMESQIKQLKKAKSDNVKRYLLAKQKYNQVEVKTAK